MSELQQKFDKLLQDQSELKRQFQAQAQELFKGVMKEFFEHNPGITGIVWTQYTPYFNDGETCEFGVNDPTFTNAKDLDAVSPWGEYGGDEEGVWATDSISSVLNTDREYKKELKKTILSAGGVDPDSCDAFARILLSADMRDVFQAMFGDHVKVAATRDGFDIDDYDHD